MPTLLIYAWYLDLDYLHLSSGVASVGVAGNNTSQEIAVHAVWLLFHTTFLITPWSSSAAAAAADDDDDEAAADEAKADANAAVFLSFSLLEIYGAV